MSTESIQKIWAHGYGCDCDNCKQEEYFGPYVVRNEMGNNFIDFALPISFLDIVELEDQHGNHYELVKVRR